MQICFSMDTRTGFIWDSYLAPFICDRQFHLVLYRVTQEVRWITLLSSVFHIDLTDHSGSWGWIDKRQISSLTRNSTSYTNQWIPALEVNQQLCSNPFRPEPVWDDKFKHSQTLQEVLIHFRSPEFTAIDRFLLSLSPRKSNVSLNLWAVKYGHVREMCIRCKMALYTTLQTTCSLGQVAFLLGTSVYLICKMETILLTYIAGGKTWIKA